MEQYGRSYFKDSDEDVKEREEVLLENRTAIITGAARGIGKGIADVFSLNGAKLVLCDVLGDEVKGVAAEIEEKTKNPVKSIAIDVVIQSDREKLVNYALEEYGSIDILVNNAGVIVSQPVQEVDEKTWDLIYNVNVKAMFFLCQAVLKVMIPQRSGRIINISSQSAIHPFLDESVYCSSKAAVVAITRVLALELGIYNINCNAICPGATLTPMFNKASEEFKKQTLEKQAIKRFAEPKDIGNVALFLASPLSSHITGEHIIVNAGEIMSQ